MYRALIIGMPLDILSTPFKLPHAKDTNQASEHDKTIIWDLIFPIALDLCHSTSETLSRRLAFNTFNETLRLIKKFIQSMKGTAGPVFGYASPAMFFDELQRRILPLVWNNWADPSDPIVVLVFNIFECLLDMYFIMKPSFKSDDACYGFIGDLVNHLLYVENHRKVSTGTAAFVVLRIARLSSCVTLIHPQLVQAKYTALNAVLQRTGASNISDLRPDFITQMLQPLR